jgi:hypothetical protein
VIPTVRDSSVRGCVSCSAEAFPEVLDERLQTQRRYCGRVSEYRPRSLLTEQLSRLSISLSTTLQGCGTKWSIATANPDATGTVFQAKIGLSPTVYVQGHRCQLIKLILCPHLLQPTIHSLRSLSVTASCGPHSLRQ